MLGNRNSQHTFAQVPSVNHARSKFDRSFALKDIIYFDLLTPIFVDEILPGDTANVNLSMFARLATQLVPIMDNLYIDFFFFFVPNRLTWENWEKFCGAQDNPGDSTDFVIPQLAPFPAGGPAVDTVFDKCGLPINVAAGYGGINALPFRAQNKIWNDWFRDENLQDSIPLLTDDGPDPLTTYGLNFRGKRKDYFTSGLPWPQKGAAVTLPLGSTAPVISNGMPPLFTNSANSYNMQMNAGDIHPAWTSVPTSSGTTDVLFNGTNTGLQADLTNATAATINALRQAFQVQGLLELDARGGTRYVEILRAHFGVISPDFRLQRSEYLGGGSVKINSHPVAQTSPTSGDNLQAQLASFATASSSGRIGFSKAFVEHGYVIGFACPRADITYQQGVRRMWLRETRYDFFWSKLQELGEQATTNKEIYTTGTSADDDVFCYQERYGDYRYMPSEIHGQFRSTAPQPLDYWHMAEDFGTAPALNAAFIRQNTPIDRALANESAPQVLMDCFFQYTHARPMATYSVPVTLGRF